MQNFEVSLLARFWVPVHRIGIALAEETEVVGIFQPLDTRRIAVVLLVVMLNRAHVGRSPASHLLFAITFDLLANFGEHGEQRNRDHGQGQHERDHDVTALANL